jgi:predicted RNA-binding Zn ribbon-like protein
MSTPVEFPTLGEVPAIELANTRYGPTGDTFDYLGTPALARAWVAEVLPRASLDDVSALRELREAARSALMARMADQLPSAKVIAVLNRHAAAACAHVALTAVGDEARVQVHYRGAAAARAQLATSCIELLMQAVPIRRCQGAGCGLFFAPRHLRRRFCHESCSHRARQARYLQGRS